MSTLYIIMEGNGRQMVGTETEAPARAPADDGRTDRLFLPLSRAFCRASSDLSLHLLFLSSTRSRIPAVSFGVIFLLSNTSTNRMTAIDVVA